MNDKWGRRLFTTGAVVLVILGLIHSLSLIRELVPANDTERQLFHLMDTYRFNLMGSMRTMTELFRGFSVCFTVASIGLGVLDLSLLREPSALLKRVALIHVLWLGALVVIALKYFFAAPLAFQALALAIFAAAWIKLPGKHAT
jgi:hypothetical protein